jgi:hypothetical protein
VNDDITRCIIIRVLILKLPRVSPISCHSLKTPSLLYFPNWRIKPINSWILILDKISSAWQKCGNFFISPWPVQAIFHTPSQPDLGIEALKTYVQASLLLATVTDTRVLGWWLVVRISRQEERYAYLIYCTSMKGVRSLKTFSSFKMHHNSSHKTLLGTAKASSGPGCHQRIDWQNWAMDPFQNLTELTISFSYCRLILFNNTEDTSIPSRSHSLCIFPPRTCSLA